MAARCAGGHGEGTCLVNLGRNAVLGIQPGRKTKLLSVKRSRIYFSIALAILLALFVLLTFLLDKLIIFAVLVGIVVLYRVNTIYKSKNNKELQK